MPQRKIELVLSSRIYPKKSVVAAMGAFKDFIEVTTRKSSFDHAKYEIKVFPGVCAKEAIAEFFNFLLGCVKNRL